MCEFKQVSSCQEDQSINLFLKSLSYEIDERLLMTLQTSLFHLNITVISLLCVSWNCGILQVRESIGLKSSNHTASYIVAYSNGIIS